MRSSWNSHKAIPAKVPGDWARPQSQYQGIGELPGFREIGNASGRIDPAGAWGARWVASDSQLVRSLVSHDVNTGPAGIAATLRIPAAAAANGATRQTGRRIDGLVGHANQDFLDDAAGIAGPLAALSFHTVTGKSKPRLGWTRLAGSTYEIRVDFQAGGNRLNDAVRADDTDKQRSRFGRCAGAGLLRNCRNPVVGDLMLGSSRHRHGFSGCAH